jgi:hypothetical protein
MYGGHCVISKVGTFKTFLLKFGENSLRYIGINYFHLSGSQKAGDPVNTVRFRVGFVMDKLVPWQVELGFPLRVTILVAVLSHCVSVVLGCESQ